VCNSLLIPPIKNDSLESADTNLEKADDVISMLLSLTIKRTVTLVITTSTWYQFPSQKLTFGLLYSTAVIPSPLLNDSRT